MTSTEFLWWAWPKQVSPEICKAIITEATAIGFKQGVVGHGEGVMDLNIRTNEVSWLKRMHAAECILGHHAFEANKVNWDFDVQPVIEPVQVAKYEVDQFYDIHSDRRNYDDKLSERKLTAVLMLSEKDNYDGGELKINNMTSGRLEVGTIVVFPSFVHHQVTPITRGVRYTATCWVPGPFLR